jgi:hypothetical protein
MLAAVDENGPLFGDTGPNAVCSFDLLGPDTAQPNAPLLEFIGPCWIAAMVNSDSIPVAQENDISLLPHDRVETIDFFPGVQDDISQRLA